MNPFNRYLPAQFKASVGGVECQLDLHLHEAGRVMGTFKAEGETLEVRGGVPSALGEVFGLLCVPSHNEALAVFRARLIGPKRLEMDVNLPNPHDAMGLLNAERMVFQHASHAANAMAQLEHC